LYLKIRLGLDRRGLQEEGIVVDGARWMVAFLREGERRGEERRGRGEERRM
jgi:hypothetical protein